MTAATSSAPWVSTSEQPLVGDHAIRADSPIRGQQTLRVRSLQVDGGRIERWAAGFGERHGAATAERGADRITLTAADGCSAVLHLPFPHGPADVEDPVDGSAEAAAHVVSTNALAPRTVLALLVRRGGYGCAVIENGVLTASKAGTRHVQGKTAAGGWSQQRFSRRRDGQTDVLVNAAADVATRILLPVRRPDVLVTGGDRPLLERVLSDPRLKPVAGLPQGPHLGVGDPRSRMLHTLPQLIRAVRIDLHEIGPRH